MKLELLSRLKCPFCHFPDLKPENLEWAEGEIRQGTLYCPGCDRQYPIESYIPSFIPGDQAGQKWRHAWSYKWEKIAHRIRYSADGDYDFNIKMNYTRLFNSDLKGKWVLDAGCGSGQDSARVARSGANVIGIDQSSGIYLARQYNASQAYYSNMHFIRADLFLLPLKDEIFDMIFSNGVLHHTPETKKAFDSLPRLLKKGGTLTVWVYDRTQDWRLFEIFWRPLLNKLPYSILALFLHLINRPWYWIYRYRHFFMNKVNPRPDSGVARHIFDLLCGGHLMYLLTDYHLHIAVKEDDHFIRYHHAFDCYSPHYAWGHDEAELFSWFKEHQFRIVGISQRRCGMTGEKAS